MKKRAQQIVTEIETSFNDCGKGLTDELATEIITQKLDEAFDKLDDTERTALYKALSLEFHSDRLNQKTTSFAEHLKSLNHIDLPQKLLNNYKAAPSAQALFEDPTTAAQDWVTFILATKLNYLDNNCERYVQPFRFLISTVKWLLVIANVIAITAVLGFVHTISLPQFLIKTLMDVIVCGGKVDKFIDREAIKIYGKDNGLSNLSEESIDQFLATKEGKDASSNISIRHHLRLKAVAKALWETISEDLPESKIKAFFSVTLIRPLAIVLGPVFLAIEATFELVRLIHASVVVALLVSFVAQLATYLTLVNLPLLLIDALGLLFHGLANACSRSKEEAYVPSSNNTLGADAAPSSAPDRNFDPSDNSAFEGGYDDIFTPTPTTDYKTPNPDNNSTPIPSI